MSANEDTFVNGSLWGSSCQYVTILIRRTASRPPANFSISYKNMRHLQLWFP
jgi:hypothetical protein